MIFEQNQGGLRVTEHPILGDLTQKKTVLFYFDGKEVRAFEGETIAAALLAAGYRIFRYTRRLKKPRSLFCGIGQCTDCSMIVDGVSNVRTCVTRVQEGMRVETQTGNGKLELSPSISQANLASGNTRQ